MFTFAGGAISWTTKKQTTVAASTQQDSMLSSLQETVLSGYLSAGGQGGRQAGGDAPACHLGPAATLGGRGGGWHGSSSSGQRPQLLCYGPQPALRDRRAGRLEVGADPEKGPPACRKVQGDDGAGGRGARGGGRAIKGQQEAQGAEAGGERARSQSGPAQGDDFEEVIRASRKVQLYLCSGNRIALL
ncbi:hypothetical protein BCV69DRAFT_201231 [Microstroma glucosiphilum]|uniref:Uncharacterized protein n=1 Tax=Pseudomicrostroma glucosiphilum TaxID=1684307 RepID=A0A316U6J6_9BASI|nr:hypothetical protein BCV69DRAFT_201231 [Pseudomicrostroma glucosiphilum]PWN20849.1 hypothetical protein BCV69DRAFT_201231 [Pseudomicrostroma glucosiphilum]